MPEPSKWHLKPPHPTPPLVISTLNHIRESDSVRAGLPRPPPLPSAWPRQKAREKGPQGSDQVQTTFTDALTEWGAKTQTCACWQTPLAVSASKFTTSVPARPPLQTEHMVPTPKTKQTGWPPRRTVHGVRLVFCSPLTRSIYAGAQKHSTPSARVTYLLTSR